MILRKLPFLSRSNRQAASMIFFIAPLYNSLSFIGIILLGLLLRSGLLLFIILVGDDDDIGLNDDDGDDILFIFLNINDNNNDTNDRIMIIMIE